MFEMYCIVCKNGWGVVFLCVVRGKVLEGVDFDKEFGCIVINIGVLF